jgi:hypothetical protein
VRDFTRCGLLPEEAEEHQRAAGRTKERDEVGPCRVACRVSCREIQATRQGSALRNDELSWQLSGLSGFCSSKERPRNRNRFDCPRPNPNDRRSGS